MAQLVTELNIMGDAAPAWLENYAQALRGLNRGSIRRATFKALGKAGDMAAYMEAAARQIKRGADPDSPLTREFLKGILQTDPAFFRDLVKDAATENRHRYLDGEV